MGLTEKEQSGRNYLKEKKPLVFEKVSKFTEKFQRGESIAIIQLQYNYICNMKCEHCSIKRFQGANQNRRLTPKDVGRIAEQADEMGLARFVISGGEPTIFPDLEEIVNEINPEKFYINCDTNGWLLAEKAEYLKSIGIDRMQLSIDSLDPEEHDAFRHMPGAHARALEGIKVCQEVGLPLYIQTVVTKERLHSEEFIQFLKYFNGMGLNVFVGEEVSGMHAFDARIWAGHGMHWRESVPFCDAVWRRPSVSVYPYLDWKCVRQQPKGYHTDGDEHLSFWGASGYVPDRGGFGLYSKIRGGQDLS